MKKYFITGLVILTPLLFTAGVVIFFMNILTRPFIGIVEGYLFAHGIQNFSFLFLSGQQVVHIGSQIIILLMIFFVLVVLGALAHRFFIRTLIRLGDYILHRIPFINTIYKTSQEILKTVFDSQFKSFKQVVMVPFPNPESFSIGFITRTAPATCSDAINHTLVSVFVPTTPNPTSGYLLMCKKENIIYVDFEVEDAIKFIISCGVIHPTSVDTLKKFTERSKSEDFGDKTS